MADGLPGSLGVEASEEDSASAAATSTVGRHHHVSLHTCNGDGSCGRDALGCHHKCKGHYNYKASA